MRSNICPDDLRATTVGGTSSPEDTRMMAMFLRQQATVIPTERHRLLRQADELDGNNVASIVAPETGMVFHSYEVC